MSIRERPALGLLLESVRVKKRFSKEALARAAGVSAGYIGRVEVGVDARTGKPVKPSPTVLRLLADALGDGDRSEADRIYREFMSAAGYIAEEPKPRRPAEKTIEQRVLEENPDLQMQFRRVAQYWYELTAEERSLVISFLQFVQERHRPESRKRGEDGESAAA